MTVRHRFSYDNQATAMFMLGLMWALGREDEVLPAFGWHRYLDNDNGKCWRRIDGNPAIMRP